VAALSTFIVAHALEARGYNGLFYYSKLDYVEGK
jgi:hypothetical protein